MLVQEMKQLCMSLFKKKKNRPHELIHGSVDFHGFTALLLLSELATLHKVTVTLIISVRPPVFFRPHRSSGFQMDEFS